MSWNQKLRKLFVCGALLAGLLYGSPMKPEEIEELFLQPADLRNNSNHHRIIL